MNLGGFSSRFSAWKRSAAMAEITLKKLTPSKGSVREARRTRVQLEAARFTGDASIVFDRESGATEVAGALGDR